MLLNRKLNACLGNSKEILRLCTIPALRLLRRATVKEVTASSIVLVDGCGSWYNLYAVLPCHSNHNGTNLIALDVMSDVGNHEASSLG